MVADALSRRLGLLLTRPRGLAPAGVASPAVPAHRDRGRPQPRRRWTDTRHAPPGAFRARAIPDSALASSRVPRHGDSWETVVDFALSYDGHAYWHGLPELAARVRRGWIRDASLPEDVAELRACLFHEQRRWHHFGHDPAGRSAEFMWALVDAIRSCAELSERAPISSRRQDRGSLPARSRRVELVLAPPRERNPEGQAAWVYDLCRASARRALGARHEATSFAHNDPGYVEWMRAHPDGFVLNVAGRGSAAQVTLHIATCAAIRPTPRRDRTTSSIRVCAPCAATLAAWVSTTLQHEPAPCGRCRP